MTGPDAPGRPPSLSAVVALARNGVIGQGGRMPWTLPSDLRRFRRLTMGRPMIMGRKTLEAIGRALDGRDSIVVSRARELPIPGAHLVHTAEDALGQARRLAAARGAAEIAVVGGGEIYALLMDRLDRLYVTHVEAEPDGDARFPPIPEADWRLEAEEPPGQGAGDSAPTRFATYVRR